MDYFLHHGLGDPPAVELLHDGHHGEFPSVGSGREPGASGWLDVHRAAWLVAFWLDEDLIERPELHFGKTKNICLCLTPKPPGFTQDAEPTAARWISPAAEEPL